MADLCSSLLLSLLKKYLKDGRLMISANFVPSKDGPEHEDLTEEVKFSLHDARLFH